MTGAILLDLDRTLVDVQSFTDYDAAWRDVVSLLGEGHWELGPDTGWTAATRACMSVLGRLPAGEGWALASEAVAVHERAAVPVSVPMPGAEAFLQRIAGRPLAVVTLLPTDVARAALDRHGLAVGVVIGRDPRIRPKPAGAGLLRALDLLGAGPEGAVMVGDSTWDAAAAREAGVGFVGVHAPPSEFAAFPGTAACETLAEVLGHLVRARPSPPAGPAEAPGAV